MSYLELFREENNAVLERLELSFDRISEIKNENSVDEPFLDYFKSVVTFIEIIESLINEIKIGDFEKKSIIELKELNNKLYEDIHSVNYEQSYANPKYAVDKLGFEYGQLLSFLYVEIRGIIGAAFEYRLEPITVSLELFIEIYNMFECIEDLTYKAVKDSIYWYASDYCDVFVSHRVREMVDTSLDFAKKIVIDSDLNNLSYLYKYGEYVSESDYKLAEFMNTLPEAKVKLMADTYVEGYRKGFELEGIDLTKKESVAIRFPIGMERMVAIAIKSFENLGLKPVIYRHALNAVNKSARGRIGYSGSSANRQYDYDHRFDNALYTDKEFIDRKLGVYKSTFEIYKEQANKHAGPAVIESFGAVKFDAVNYKEALSLTEKQRKLEISYANEAGRITNTYIPGDERSFTIIAFPVPEIGENFAEIFEEIIHINTLDYKLYENIQQTIIDTLDKAEYIRILGKGENKTDIKVYLQEIKNPEKETKFENCVADVNIPLGEVFTSPKLKGTNGKLFVSGVYLEGTFFKNLCIEFKDGMISDYSCENFDSEEENRKLIEANILFQHDTLPLGEFAIGTNTTAYAVAVKYDIFDKLPILIAEKMGPHFAVGDTCYTWSEDTAIYNPNGKEIIAKENEVSALRKEDISKAYMNCHTDITIPYHELGNIIAITSSGEELPIISEGKFVLKGTEELNYPLNNI